jgi:hypothetical protein
VQVSDAFLDPDPEVITRPTLQERDQPDRAERLAWRALEATEV